MKQLLALTFGALITFTTPASADQFPAPQPDVAQDKNTQVQPASANPAQAANVNSRYTVEAVELRPDYRKHLSQKLQDELDQMVGEKYQDNKAQTLASRIRKELRAVEVECTVKRGEQPEHIRIVYETTRRRFEEDTSVTKLSYHSKQGWTGGVEASTHLSSSYGMGTQLAFGVQSDGDELIERYAGINGRVTQSVGEYVRIRFAWQSFHEQWNDATLQALAASPGVPGIYRERENFEPSISIALPGQLTFTTGVSFQRMQFQFPAVLNETSGAVVNTLRYRRQWEFANHSGQELDAGYNLRAATRMLDSDFVYVRHFVNASYSRRWEHQGMSLRATLGHIDGDAPLFERFVLGNTQTLRGWNKYDLNPLGGTRMAHASFDYRFRLLQLFYDTGSVWDNKQAAIARHSVGIGLGLGNLRDGLTVSVGFPIRDGHLQPLFLMSANF